MSEELFEAERKEREIHSGGVTIRSVTKTKSKKKKKDQKCFIWH